MLAPYEIATVVSLYPAIFHALRYLMIIPPMPINQTLLTGVYSYTVLLMDPLQQLVYCLKII
jgi:hypothetical protein